MPAADGPGPCLDLRDVTVLVVEDYDASRRALCAIVTALGARAVPARDAAEALAAVAQEKPDLILCDLRMPGMDGFELLRRLRADVSLAAVPAIAMSGLDSDADREQISLAGFAGHLLKPVDLRMVAAEIERVFGARGKP
jgi:hypothetical protein